MNYESQVAEAVWGIREPGLGNYNASRFALVAGAIYVVVGVVGFFVTGFDHFTEVTDEALFGVFHLTPFHNVAHIGLGAVWLFAAFLLSPVATEGVNFALGAVYALVAILGYLGFLQLLGIHQPFEADNFLHLFSGLAALLFSGLVPPLTRHD